MIDNFRIKIFLIAVSLFCLIFVKYIRIVNINNLYKIYLLSVLSGYQVISYTFNLVLTQFTTLFILFCSLFIINDCVYDKSKICIFYNL